VGDPGDAVLPPAVGAAPRRVVREVLPGPAVRAVVLAHRPPLPLGEIGPPEPPRPLAAIRLPQPPPFHRHGCRWYPGGRGRSAADHFAKCRHSDSASSCARTYAAHP